MRACLLVVLAGCSGAQRTNRTNCERTNAVSAPARAVQVAAGASRTCVLTDAGMVRCWGEIDECPRLSPWSGRHPQDVPLGVTATSIAVGGHDLCAIATDRSVRCFGRGKIVNVIANATQVAIGGNHACALVDGTVHCWGWSERGELGGADRERHDSPRPVFLGKRATAIDAGASHTCAILDDKSLRCWGRGFDGPLGYGTEDSIGDDEQPASAGDVPVGEPVEAVVLGGKHTCVLLARGRVKCWGDSDVGQLGTGFVNPVFDARKAAEVPLGGIAVALAAGGGHTCALLDTGAVRCWGEAANGQLGYATEVQRGKFNRIGDNEPASIAGDVPIGEKAVQITAGAAHTCARLASGAVRCWGEAYHGALGYPADLGKSLFDSDIGDDETPAQRGNVPFAPNWEAP